MLNNYGSAFMNISRTQPSNGLTLHLPLPPRKSKHATIVTINADPSSSSQIETNSQGSNSILSNGNHILGYGQIPIGREYGPALGSNTNIRWEARFGRDNLVQNYRLFKQEWHATPLGTKPSLFVDKGSNDHSCRFAYASWNGATDIREWKVFEGVGLDYIGSVPFRGFETRFRVRGPVVLVIAVMEDGLEYKSDVIPVL
jgi:hypothetical protein